MVCYARPALRMAAVLLVVFVVFGRSAGHFFNATGLLVALAVAVGGAALMAAVAFAVFLSVRRRRAVTGGCVHCQLRCQHAMTEGSRRLLIASTVDRGAAAVGRVPLRAGAPRPPVRAQAPRWPDRPALSSRPARVPQSAAAMPRPVPMPRPGGGAERRERARV